HRRGQRQGDHQRNPGLHRPWRRHRGDGGVPAGPAVTAAPAGRVPAHGAPVLRARLRETPEDFRVEELDGFEASGSGEHLLLTVEMRGMNTAFAASHIARWAGVGEVAV